MNKTVTNLSMIADAAEYFDRKTGAAWKIRGSLTSMLVWSANGLIYSLETGDPDRIYRSRAELATLRVWAKDANTSSFVLDLTPTAVARTLGLERQVDNHVEATRIARNKCMLSRSAARFTEYYKAALAAAEEQRRVRQSRVELISNMLSDTGFALSIADRDCMATYHGYDPRSLGEAITDEELYNDDAVERQRDTLSEVVGNALESMYEVCDYELTAAITTEKVTRLTGYKRAIEHMFDIVGVDKKKLGARRAKLEAAIDAMAKQQDMTTTAINEEIESEISKMMQHEPTQTTHAQVSVDDFCEILAANAQPEANTTQQQAQAPKKPPMRRVKKEDLAQEMASV